MESIAKATAIYTGGGIYLYVGQLADGTYFLTADDYMDYVLFLDTDPCTCIDDCCYEQWQSHHRIGDYSKEKALAFKKLVLEWVITNAPEGNYQKNEIIDRLKGM